MKTHVLSIPLIGLIAFTRGLLGAGIALLIGDRLTKEQRRAVGWTLVGIGVFSTFPLLALIFGSERREA